MTRVPLCRDRVFLRLGHSCRDRRLYVVAGFPRVVLRQRVSCRNPQTRVGRMHDRPRHAHERAHQRRCCTRDIADRAHRPCYHAHSVWQACNCAHGRHEWDSAVTGTSLSRQTCPVANSALRCALFELLFIDTVHGHCSQEVSKFGFQTNGSRKKSDPRDLGRHR